MTKQTRRKLFYLSIIIFVFLSIGVLSFAFGISYDFANNQIIKTGSISINTNQDAQIFINNEWVGNTSLLGNSYSKRNLLPETYQVEVRQEGFYPWTKAVDVEAGLVTDFSRILLVSENPSAEILRSSISAAFLSDDRWVIYVQDKEVTFFDLYSQKIIYQFSSTGLNLKKLKVIWEASHQKLFMHDGTAGAMIDLNLKSTMAVHNIPAYFLNEQTAFDGAKIYNMRFQKKRGYLESFEINTGHINLVAEELNSFYLFGDKIFFISDFDKRPYLTHLGNARIESFAALINPVSGQIRQIEDANDQIYFLAGGDLYVANSKETVLLATGVKTFAISPDRYLLSWVSNREVWIAGIKENLYQPQRKVGESELLLTLTKMPSNLFWHRDSAHLIISTTDQALLVETDSRGGINQYDLLQGQSYPQWRYNSNLNKIVNLKSGKLYLISF